MASIQYFRISNFRGAADVQITLEGKISSRVITLIGLNESGKTTILEGLSHFPTNDAAVSSMFTSRVDEKYANSLVPSQSVGKLNGSVRIYGLVLLSDEDRKEIHAIVKSARLELDVSRQITSINVSKSYNFKDGDYIHSNISNWGGIDLYVRKIGSLDSYEKYVHKKGRSKSSIRDIWREVADHLEKKMPNILYFPNFVVDLPERIYVEPFDEESKTNQYYRRIIDNALSSKHDGYNLQKHIIDRLKKLRLAKGPNVRLRDILSSGTEKDKVDAVFNDLSAILTEEVIGSWSKVFGTNINSTRVDVKWSVDTSSDLLCAEIKIANGHSIFHLSQRSLGFRWFFAFLLFTRFGGEKGRRNIFLLDEPAANLHAKAQAELRESFGRLAEAGDMVIYSTHSHHLIAPEWLSGAYIVENDAIDYDMEDLGVYKPPAPTNIKVTPYRKFVGENGSRVSYFQPVIERLQYVEPSLVGRDFQILVEGPSDFYALNYVVRSEKWKNKITIIPGGGAGSLDALISIAMSRGYKFVVLLDNDPAGIAAQKRYRKKFLLGDEVCTILDLDSTMAGKALEGLLSEDTLARVRSAFGNTSKAAIANYLAEACALGTESALSPDTRKSILGIIDAAANKMGLV